MSGEKINSSDAGASPIDHWRAPPLAEAVKRIEEVRADRDRYRRDGQGYRFTECALDAMAILDGLDAAKATLRDIGQHVEDLKATGIRFGADTNAALDFITTRCLTILAGNGSSGEKAGLTQAAEGSEPSSDSEKAMSWLFDVINCLCAEVPSLNEAIYARTIQSELLRLKSLNAELREGLSGFVRMANVSKTSKSNPNTTFVDTRDIEAFAARARSLLSRTT